MATQTWRPSEAHSEDGRICYVEFDYNDQNSQATLVRWDNDIVKPVNCKITLPNGKAVFDGTLPLSGSPGSSGTFALSGADRFNVVTQAPSVNLAPWSTPTEP